MSVYSEQYWTSLASTIGKMDPEALAKRFGNGTLDKIQKLKLSELKKQTDPNNPKLNGDSPVKKKKHITEREFEHHFRELAGGL